VAEGERDAQVVDLTRETAVDGDDITVITHESAPDPNRRRRIVLLAFVGVVLLAGLIAALVALRHDDSTSVSTDPVASTPSLPASTIATAKKDRAVAAAAATKKATTATPTSAAKVATPPPTIAPAVAPPAATGSNPGAIPPSQPATHATTPPTVPKTSPLSALVWTAPANVSMQSGTQVHVTVSVRNPTDGTVTLPHPLSCTPRLQHDEVCPEMAQLVGPHQIAGTIYVLDATGVAPGVYRLKLEGVRPLTVTVTA
jgi:hypothetical protein